MTLALAKDEPMTVKEPSTMSDLTSSALQIKSLRLEERQADFIASTEAIDADGDIVEQSWDLDRYMKNPVVLFGHSSKDLPIGHATNVGVKDGQLQATIVFASEKANPMAERVWQSVQERTLRAVSVGFKPREVRQETRNDKDVYVLSDNELYEISVVPIPSNPEALTRMKALAHKERVVPEKGAVAYQAYKPVEEGSWDSSAAKKRISGWAGDDWGKYRKGFAWFSPEDDDTKGGYKLPHHDIKSGEMVTVKEGVIAAGNALMGSRGGVDIPEEDVTAVKAHLAKHYRQFNLTPPWEREQSTDGGKEKKAMELEKAMVELESTKAQLTSEKEKVETLNKRCMDLEEERNEYRKQADTLRVSAVEKTLDDLVGVKIAPTEKDTLIKLATQSPELFEEHLKAIESRPDMNILKNVSEDVIGEDPTPKALPVGNDSGAEFEALVKQLGA